MLKRWIRMLPVLLALVMTGARVTIAQAFTPPANCTEWLEANVGMYQSGTRASPGTVCANANDPVGLWLDQSGNNNDVTAASSLPHYNPTAFTTAGLPGVKFDNGASCKLQSGGSFFSSAYDTAFSFFIVEVGPPTTNEVLISDGGGTSNFYVSKNPSGGSTGNQLAINTPHLSQSTTWTPPGQVWNGGVWSCVYGGSYGMRMQYERFLNGATTNTGSSTATGNLGMTGALTIGNLSTGSFGWKDGYISEVLIFNRALTFAEQRYVNDYLTGKWKLNYYNYNTVVITGNSLTAGTGTSTGAIQEQQLDPVGGTMGYPYKAPTVAVTGGGSTGGSLAAGTYYGKITYSTANGESLPSPETVQFTVGSGNIPQMTTAYSSTLHQASWSLYLTPTNGTSGSETLYASGITTATYNMSAAYPGSSTVPPTSATNVGTTLPAQIGYLLGPNTAVYYDGYPGRYIAGQMSVECPYSTDRLYLPSGGGKHVLIIWEITNDIGASGDYTGVTTYNNLVTLCKNERSLGWIVVVVTCNPRDDGVSANWYTARSYINTQLRATWRSFADELIDITQIYHLQTQADCSNATYFAGDKVHNTDTGYKYYAPVFTGPALAKMTASGVPVVSSGQIKRGR